MSKNIALANAFKAACLTELEALKPGNVHIFADGHGMTVQDFLLSAEAASTVIAQPNLSLGQRILQSVQATQNMVGLNTNLGIILLCAPIIHAALQAGESDFSTKLSTVLSNTTIEDAECAFAAIRLASPAGLGDSAQQDVNQSATETLYNTMQIAAPRDLIARQYTNHFADIFAAVKHYQSLLTQWQRPAWAATGVYLHFMANFYDSHIMRKYGEAIAKMVQAEAAAHQADFVKAYNPKTFQTPLLAFDAALKKRGLNPGTNADMTVAVLLMVRIAEL